MSTPAFGWVAAAAFLLGAVSAPAQSYKLEPRSVPIGLGSSTDGNFMVEGGTTRPIETTMLGGGFEIVGGFRSIVPVAKETPTGLVINGSFENTGSTFVPDADGLMSVPPGSTAIPGWTTTTAELAWMDNANTFGAVTPFGAQSLDLTGNHDGPPYGAIAQTFATVPGESYRVSFSIGAYQDLPAYRGPMTVDVTAGPASRSFTFEPDGAGSQWKTFELEFTAADSASELAFAGSGTGGGAYLGLDNVSVIPGRVMEALRITSVLAGDGTLQITFPSESNRTYVAESQSDLDSGSWTSVEGTMTAGTGGEVTVNVAIDASLPRRFFRIRMDP